MRFLHTADLHIGKRLFETSLSEDQREILRQIAEIAVNEHCDAVLIAVHKYLLYTIGKTLAIHLFSI